MTQLAQMTHLPQMNQLVQVIQLPQITHRSAQMTQLAQSPNSVK